MKDKNAYISYECERCGKQQKISILSYERSCTFTGDMVGLITVPLDDISITCGKLVCGKCNKYFNELLRSAEENAIDMFNKRRKRK